MGSADKALCQVTVKKSLHSIVSIKNESKNQLVTGVLHIRLAEKKSQNNGIAKVIHLEKDTQEFVTPRIRIAFMKRIGRKSQSHIYK